MSIEEVRSDPTPGRPWWFFAGVLGVALGGVVGFFVIPAPPVPCSPRGASSDVVVRRFFQRLGGAPSAIAECWGNGWLPSEALARYAVEPRRDEITLDRMTEGELGVPDRTGARRHQTWEITLGADPGQLFQCPAPWRFAMIVMEWDDGRWLLQSPGCMSPTR